MLGVWLPVLAYVVLVFVLSSIPDLAPPRTINHLDKLAHLLEYSIMGWLLARAFKRNRPHRVVRWASLSLITGAGIAVLDEVYQGTVGRDQSIADWTFDVVGLTTAVLVMIWFLARKQESIEKGDGW